MIHYAYAPECVWGINLLCQRSPYARAFQKHWPGLSNLHGALGSRHRVWVGGVGGGEALVALLERGLLKERARGTTHSRLANDIRQRRPSGKTQQSQLVEFLQGCPVALTQAHPRTHTLLTLYDTHKHSQPLALSTDVSSAPHYITCPSLLSLPALPPQSQPAPSSIH